MAIKYMIDRCIGLATEDLARRKNNGSLSYKGGTEVGIYNHTLHNR